MSPVQLCFAALVMMNITEARHVLISSGPSFASDVLLVGLCLVACHHDFNQWLICVWLRVVMILTSGWFVFGCVSS